jgi:DNA-binding PadR family transcriptional regulator
MSGSAVSLTPQTLALLQAMLDDPGGTRYGLELAATTGLTSGSLYPILSRLERAGWLESSWEILPPDHLSRPRRRVYKITTYGRFRVAEDLNDKRTTHHESRAPARTPLPTLA